MNDRSLTRISAWDQTAELTEIVRSLTRDEGIEPSTLKISAEGFEGKFPGSDNQQSGLRPGRQQQADKQSEKQQQQSQKQQQESEKQQQQQSEQSGQQQSEAGAQQGSSAGRESQGGAQKDTKGQEGGGKPESVTHLVEALKEAHVDDPDPPAAQP
jgi:hypothetical protein